MVAIVVATLGLVLFALLIGNMQVIKVCMSLYLCLSMLKCTSTHNSIVSVGDQRAHVCVM